MQLGRYLFGLLLAVASGIVVDHAWTSSDGGLWWTGALTLLSAAVLLPLVVPREEPRAPAPPDPLETTPFLLGDLLVNRFNLITYEQLVQALARQRGTTKRLGEVLVEMGLLTREDLEMVLEEQRFLRTIWQQLNTTSQAPSSGRDLPPLPEPDFDENAPWVSGSA